MSIRWKLLPLLGAMALTPFLLLRFTAYDALERVGRDLAVRSKTLLVSKADKLVTRDNYGGGNFITLLVMEIGAAGAGLAWVRAGHDPAQLYTPEDGSVRELGGPVDTPLGVTPDAGYTLQQGATFTKGP